jgi:hypothetical protein
VRRLLAAVVCVSAVCALPAGAGAASGYKSCAGGYNPDGTPGSFYRKIRAKRVGCTTARTVVKAWVRAHADGSSSVIARITVAGYSCKGAGVSAPGDPNGGLSVLCTRDGGRKAVRFYGHP